MISQRVSTRLKRWSRFLEEFSLAGGAFKDCLDFCYPGKVGGNDPSNGNVNPDMITITMNHKILIGPDVRILIFHGI